MIWKLYTSEMSTHLKYHYRSCLSLKNMGARLLHCVAMRDHLWILCFWTAIHLFRQYFYTPEKHNPCEWASDVMNLLMHNARAVYYRPRNDCSWADARVLCGLTDQVRIIQMNHFLKRWKIRTVHQSWSY